MTADTRSESDLREWFDDAVATLPMLKVDRPAKARHRRRRKYLQRRPSVWREAWRAIRRSVASAPEATSFVLSVAVLAGLTIGASL